MLTVKSDPTKIYQEVPNERERERRKGRRDEVMKEEVFKDEANSVTLPMVSQLECYGCLAGRLALLGSNSHEASFMIFIRTTKEGGGGVVVEAG